MFRTLLLLVFVGLVVGQACNSDLDCTQKGMPNCWHNGECHRKSEFITEVTQQPKRPGDQACLQVNRREPADTDYRLRVHHLIVETGARRHVFSPVSGELEVRNETLDQTEVCFPGVVGRSLSSIPVVRFGIYKQKGQSPQMHEVRDPQGVFAANGCGTGVRMDLERGICHSGCSISQGIVIAVFSISLASLFLSLVSAFTVY